jgi:glyoxylase-like metal-dependent hydrolase (beta-lactamase superfamily II)
MKNWETKSGYRIIQVLSGRSNVFLLTDGNKSILIDTGPKNNWEKLEKHLNGLKIDRLDFLILTHTHFDHAANAKKIKEKYGPLVIVQRTEAPYLTSGDNIIPNGTNIITRLIINLFANRVLKRLNYDPCQYDIPVDSFLDLKDFGFNAYIIHTPGHTVGSMSVVVDNEVAIVGDAMFGVFKWSVFPPYATDIEELINSWGRLLETDCSVFIPAHGSANNRILVQKDFDKRK